jgi:hypothetical protein
VTGITDLTNGAWHHRRHRDASANRIRIYVDGSEKFDGDFATALPPQQQP